MRLKNDLLSNSNKESPACCCRPGFYGANPDDYSHHREDRSGKGCVNSNNHRFFDKYLSLFEQVREALPELLPEADSNNDGKKAQNSEKKRQQTESLSDEGLIELLMKKIPGYRMTGV